MASMGPFYCSSPRPLPRKGFRPARTSKRRNAK